MSKIGYLEALNANVFGFERMLTLLESFHKSSQHVTGYPPFNVRKINSKELMIEVAVAGFDREELSLVIENGKLTVSGEKKSTETNEYLYQGIANRTFHKQYALADSVLVKNASLIDGILYILLEINIPEEKLPKTIEISEIPLTKKQELLLEEKKKLAEATSEKI